MAEGYESMVNTVVISGVRGQFTFLFTENETIKSCVGGLILPGTFEIK